MTPTREQLASIEWAVVDAFGQPEICPACYDDRRLGRGHAPDCWLAACLAAPPPEPQAMQPIEPGDWVRLVYGHPNPELVVGVREDDPSLHDETVDLSGFGWTRLSEIAEIRKANGDCWKRSDGVWTREPRR